MRKTLLSTAVATALGLVATQANAGQPAEVADCDSSVWQVGHDYHKGSLLPFGQAVNDCVEHPTSEAAEIAQNAATADAQSTADDAVTDAANAQSTADGAVTVNGLQQTEINTLLTGVTNLWTDQDRQDSELDAETQTRITNDRAVAAYARDLDAADRDAQLLIDDGQDTAIDANTSGVATNAGAIASETATRITNDRVVDSRAIARTAVEAQERQDADGVLQSNIQAEAGYRIDGDNALWTDQQRQDDEMALMDEDIIENEERGLQNESDIADNAEDIAENSDDIETIGDEVYGPEGDENGESRIDRNENAIANAENARGSRDLDVDRTFAEHDQRIEGNTAAIQQNSNRIDGLESDVSDLKGGVALGIAAAQHQFDYSYSGLQGSLALGHYETQNATSLSLGGAVTERVFVNGSVGYTLEGGQFGAGAAVGFKF